jgi:GT2 family glycosyltransferase
MDSCLTLSVVIPTHNRPDSLQRLLDSLEGNQGVSEVLVIDDASEPTVAIATDGVIVLRNNAARLVSSARNTGASRAQGTILFFVDDDCVVSSKAPGLLLRAFEQDPTLGIAGPAIAYLDAQATIWCAGIDRTRWTGRTLFRGQGLPLARASDQPSASESFPSAFAVRRTCFDRVGGFDEVAFPFHMEEADLAERIRAAGYSVRLIPEALVWHDIRANDPLARRLHITTTGAYLIGRNRGFFTRKHSPTTLSRLARLSFWLGLLVPFYVAVIFLQSEGGWRSRLRIACLFLAGVWEGAVKKWSRAQR